MNWLHLLAVPITYMVATACGRSGVRWAAVSYIVGFWILILLMILPKREIQQPVIPQVFINLISLRMIRNWANKLEPSDFK